MAPELAHAAAFTIRQVIEGQRTTTYELVRYAERDKVLNFIALLRRQNPEAQVSLGVDRIDLYK